MPLTCAYLAVTFCLGAGQEKITAQQRFFLFLFHGMAYLAMAKFSLRKLYSMEKGLNKSSKSLKEKAEWKAHIAIFSSAFSNVQIQQFPTLPGRSRRAVDEAMLISPNQRTFQKNQMKNCAAACLPCLQLKPGKWFLTLPGVLEKLQGNQQELLWGRGRFCRNPCTSQTMNMNFPAGSRAS